MKASAVYVTPGLSSAGTRCKIFATTNVAVEKYAPKTTALAAMSRGSELFGIGDL